MMTNAEPVAYIRRSARSRSDPGDLSREFQTDKVRELANGDGPRLRIIDADWGRSASTDKTDRRVAFLALLEAVERGEVSALYAYSTDRLARSVEWAARLLNACRRAGTVIVTAEGRFEPDNAMTDQLFYFQAMQNEGYSRQATEKRRATVVRQRARGDKLGPAFYGALPGEDLPAVLAAFDEKGSAHGAAVLLNDRHVPTRRREVRRGDRIIVVKWTHSTVRNILIREGRLPKLGTRGAKARAPFALYRLLRCHCGRTMTAVTQRYGKGHERTIYRCVASSADPAHGPKTVAERRLLPWIAAEAARFNPDWMIERAATTEAERVSLEDQLRGVGDALVVRAYTPEQAAAKVDQIEAKLAALDDTTALSAVPVPDWSVWPPTLADGPGKPVAVPTPALNAILRSYWRTVELDATMQPIRADWRFDPEAPV
jgi:DNA invertase Pin-like site-specific DNA recombinase